jgi:hypothetical protein
MSLLLNDKKHIMQNNSKHFFNSPPSDFNSQRWLIYEIFNSFPTQFTVANRPESIVLDGLITLRGVLTPRSLTLTVNNPMAAIC